jgi:pimeloyl-ACP methyl ester carboxylesterase
LAIDRDGDEDQIQEAISADGTKIAGRVHGKGAPLVLVHGGLGDGEASWRFMLPFLVDHFTCYLMSTRGRGLSYDNADHSRERHFEDIAAFVESIGQKVYIFGHSMGAVWILGGAALVPDSITGLAVYEPGIFDPTAPAVPEETHVRMLSAFGEGDFPEAVRILVAEIIRLNSDEQAFFARPKSLEVVLRNLPAGTLDDPELKRPFNEVNIEKLMMPIGLFQGADTGEHFRYGRRYLTDRLPHARQIEIVGAGHMGPVLAPRVVAQELTTFFND